MKKVPLKILTLLTALTIFTTCFLSTGQAAGTKKTLAVWFGQMKATYNSKDVTAIIQPIVVNGYTYIPLRGLVSLFNKSITFNPSSKTVAIKEKEETTAANAQIAELKSQLTVKDAYIEVLMARIKSLESRSASGSSSKAVVIDDVQDQLNDKYDYYKGADFKITLSGDEDDITVTIKTDGDAWNNISKSYQKKYLQNIVDYILDKFKNADVDGKVKDSSTYLTTFTVSSAGEVKIAGIDSLEAKLNKDYATYKNADFEISLSGDENEVIVTIQTDADDWNNISSSYRENYLQNIASAITRMFKNANINGKVKDGSTTLVEFTYTSDGEVEVDNTSVVNSLKTEINTKLKDDAFGTLSGIDNDNLEIVIAGSTDILTYTVNINLASYGSQWDALTEDAIKAYMKKIYDYIKNKSSFTNTLMAGYFYDINGKATLAELYKSGETLKRYK